MGCRAHGWVAGARILHTEDAFKTKNDTKDEEDAGTSPSDNSIVNNPSSI
jgi:hypothetical protein